MLFKPGATFIEQLPPATEAVDQDPFDQRPLHRTQQRQGADDLCEHAAAFDVRHQQAVGPEVLGQAEVGEVPSLQIHLHRTAGPLQHQPTVGPSLLQGLEPFTDRLPARTEPVAVVMLRSGQANAGAAVDHLTGAVAPWLEQHGIHGTAGL